MDVLEIVKSNTVVGWHWAGFRLYWRWHSRARGGRPKITEEIRALIRQMAEENAGWVAPKIHGELLKWVSSSPSEPWLETCGESTAAGIPAKAGWPSWRIIAR